MSLFSVSLQLYIAFLIIRSIAFAQMLVAQTVFAPEIGTPVPSIDYSITCANGTLTSKLRIGIMWYESFFFCGLCVVPQQPHSTYRQAHQRRTTCSTWISASHSSGLLTRTGRHRASGSPTKKSYNSLSSPSQSTKSLTTR